MNNKVEMPLQITMTVHIKPDIQAINIWSTENNPYGHPSKIEVETLGSESVKKLSDEIQAWTNKTISDAATGLGTTQASVTWTVTIKAITAKGKAVSAEDTVSNVFENGGVYQIQGTLFQNVSVNQFACCVIA